MKRSIAESESLWSVLMPIQKEVNMSEWRICFGVGHQFDAHVLS